MKLEDLKTEAQHLGNQYLAKLDPQHPYQIPPYPRPEFHLTRVKHDTDRDGLRGIWRDNGFKDPHEFRVVWWSLVVGPDEINSAEEELLRSTFPDRTEEQAQMQRGFLEKFATSPAFMEASRLGSFRFTFPLKEVLKIYRDQVWPRTLLTTCCHGKSENQYKMTVGDVLLLFMVLTNGPAKRKKELRKDQWIHHFNSACECQIVPIVYIKLVHN